MINSSFRSRISVLFINTELIPEETTNRVETGERELGERWCLFFNELCKYLYFKIKYMKFKHGLHIR